MTRNYDALGVAEPPRASQYSTMRVAGSDGIFEDTTASQISARTKAALVSTLTRLFGYSPALAKALGRCVLTCWPSFREV
jgi:hypothetical protein